MGEKNTGISARIADVIERVGGTPSSFAKCLGYTRAQTIYDILNGKSAPSYDFFNRFANTEFSAIINLHWLLTGKGEMLKTNCPSVNSFLPIQPLLRYKDNENQCDLQEKKTFIAMQSDDKGIPLIPLSAMAGAFAGESSVMEYECERYVIPAFKGADFLIQVKGDSMQPTYYSGDLVACQRVPLGDIFFQWNKTYVLDTVQGPLIKRIRRGSDDDHVLVVSDNSEYEPFELSKDQFHGVALVRGLVRLE